MKARFKKGQEIYVVNIHHKEINKVKVISCGFKRLIVEWFDLYSQEFRLNNGSCIIGMNGNVSEKFHETEEDAIDVLKKY